jgi:hypothetical protein
VNRIFVRCVYLIGTLQLSISVTILFANLFSCHPIDRLWDYSIPGWCIDQVKLFAGTETVNSSIDFCMVILACYMVSSLKLRTPTKWKLAAIFTLGGL